MAKSNFTCPEIAENARNVKRFLDKRGLIGPLMDTSGRVWGQGGSMEDNERCCTKVRSVGMEFHWHQCPRKKVLVFKDKPYCKQHYPPNIEKRREGIHKRYEAEWVKKQRGWDRQAAINKAFRPLSESVRELVAWLVCGSAESNGAKCETLNDALTKAEKALRLARKAQKLGA